MTDAHPLTDTDLEHEAALATDEPTVTDIHRHGANT